MKYSLYKFLYEDALPPQRVGRHGDSTVPTTNNPPPKIRAPRAKKKPDALDTKSPSGKMEFQPHQLIPKMQAKIKTELPAISNLAKEPDPSENDVVAAKKASDDVEQNISAIADIKGYKLKSEPQQPVASPAVSPTALPKWRLGSTEMAPYLFPSQGSSMPTKSSASQQATVDIGTAKTEPQMPAVRQPAQTQPVPQVDIEKMMRNAPTQPLPQTPSPNQPKNLYQRFKNSIGLKEAIKQAIIDKIDNR
jgi:hypothetical protein